MSISYHRIEFSFQDHHLVRGLDEGPRDYWRVSVATSMEGGGKANVGSETALALAWMRQVPRLEEGIRKQLIGEIPFLTNQLLHSAEITKSLDRAFQAFFLLEGASTSPQDRLSPAAAWARYAMMRAAYLACSTQPGDYEYVTVYAAWQQYVLIKFLWSLAHEVDATATYENMVDYKIMVDDQLGKSYHALASLLRDPRYAIGFRMLWRVALRENPAAGQRTNLEQENRVGEGVLDPLIRERLRVSMILMPPDQRPKRGKTPRIPLMQTETPYPAPGCFDQARQAPATAQLHRYFREFERGRLEIQRILRNELLPNYAIDTAFQTALLERSPRWLIRVLCILTPCALLIGLVGLVLLLGFARSFSRGFPVWAWGVCLIVASAAILALPFLTDCVVWLVVWLWKSAWRLLRPKANPSGPPRRLLGLRSLFALLLPRVTGGALVGFFWLFMSSEPWYLARYANQPDVCWFWPVEWVLTFVLTGVYLHQEAFARVIVEPEARRRSVVVLLLGLYQAVVLGIILGFFARPVGQQVLHDGDAYRDLGFIPAWNLDYPVGAVITFSPLALFLGILFQTLWLEHPITASVWQPDAR